MITHALFPLEPSTDEAQAAIVDMFTLLQDWSERYQYLMDLGRQLPAFPAQWQTEANRLHGCQSQVWIVPQGTVHRLDFYARSDSAIVSGLIYIVLRVYSGRSANEIVRTPASFLEKIGLTSHLSSQRVNGVAALIDVIHGHAHHLLEQLGHPL